MNVTDFASDSSDSIRHLGLVVDDLNAVENKLTELDVDRLSTSGYDFRDPWGNRLQIVKYADIQFTKVDYVLGEMDIAGEYLQKTESALAELAEKDMAPE